MKLEGRCFEWELAYIVGTYTYFLRHEKIKKALSKMVKFKKKFETE